MAFTSPRTYVTGEIVTAGTLNVDHRDNIRYLRGMDGVVQIQDGIQMTGTGTASYLQPPVLTTTQRNAIASPANGMMIYNTTDGKLQKYEGTGWRSDLAYGGTLTYLAVPSMATGDIFYADTGTSIARLGAGTSGYFLRTQGLASAPSWETPTNLVVYSSGTALVLANDTEGSWSPVTSTPAQKKASRVAQGTYTISFDILSVDTTYEVRGSLYKNATLMSPGTKTISGTYISFSTIIGGFTELDEARLYIAGTDVTGTARYRNFRISGTGESPFKVILV